MKKVFILMAFFSLSLSAMEKGEIRRRIDNIRNLDEVLDVKDEEYENLDDYKNEVIKNKNETKLHELEQYRADMDKLKKRDEFNIKKARKFFRKLEADDLAVPEKRKKFDEFIIQRFKNELFPRGF